MQNTRTTPESIIRKLCQPLEPVPTSMVPRLTALPDIRVVLFDVYGTLLISCSGDVGTLLKKDNRTAMREALEACELADDPDAAAVKGMALLSEAMTRDHAWRKSQGAVSPEVEIREIWCEVFDALIQDDLVTEDLTEQDIERFALAYECRVNPVWPMPGCPDVLDRLRAKGKTLGIVSNAQFYTPLLFQAFFERGVEELGFDPGLCVWSFQLRRSKPAPILFQGVMQQLADRGISPAQTVYVGNDMRNDVWTAAQAGCRTILFAGDQRSLRLRQDDDHCRDLQPDAVITALSQVVELAG